MRIVIIGGTGHVGTYLVPRLVRAGHAVVNVSRGKRKPYQDAAEWQDVEQIDGDRRAWEKDGILGERIAALKPEIVIDKICYRPESAKPLVEALRGSIHQYLCTGTIWVHGEAEEVPTPEHAPRKPIGDYGIGKNNLEMYLQREHALNGFPATTIHPGHIVGPGWPILNPQGHFNLDAWKTIAAGKPLCLPNLGLECVHHVHADDVAQCFERAIERRNAAVGEGFHAVSPAALTLLGYARAAYAWFGHKPEITFAPLAELEARLNPDDAKQVREHICRSPNASIEKARRMLGYVPRFTSLEACREAAEWLSRSGFPA